MEQKFQTSFIPKKQTFQPVISGSLNTAPKQPVHGSSLYIAIAIIIFVLSLAAVGGAYFWKSYLGKTQVTLQAELAKNKEQFNIGLVTQLKKINLQIATAQQLLKRHVAISQIFSVLEHLTVTSIRYTAMDFKGAALTYSGGEGLSGMTVNLKGMGANLPALAFQSTVLADLASYGLSGMIKNPVISEPKEEINGVVTFEVMAEVDPASMSYEHAVTGQVDTASATSTSPTTP